MESSRKQRWRQLQSVFEPGFKQMLLISLLLHLLVPVLYYAPFFPQRDIRKPPVYRVNLVNKPVKNPQAGRPEAVAEKKKPEAKPAPKPEPKPLPPPPKPVAPKPEPVKPKPVPVKPKPEPQPEPKAVAKKPEVKPAPVAAPEPVKTGPTKAQESALEKRLREIREAQEKKAQETARKDRLAALKAAAVAESAKTSPIEDAPVGMIGGKGDEEGVSAVAFVQEFIQQQWSFSKYQAAGNPQAEVKLFYSTDGELLHYKFLKKSGNEAFDDSLIRAITKSRQLPQALPEAMDFHIFFNLKDMLDRR